MEKSTLLMVWIGLSMIAAVYVTNAQAFDETDRKHGDPMSASRLQLPMERQREILETYVQPYLERIEVRNETNDSQADKPIFLKVWIIADGGNGYKVFYDQLTATFGLAKYTPGITPYILNISDDPKKLFFLYK